MEQNIQTIIDLVTGNTNLSAEEKAAIITNLKETDKKITITEFKLDRTEKVKRTTAILLEETIEELEQKRKAVEAQNRELEIETALEKVRAVAMGMRQPGDMLDVCRTISQQLQSLKVKEIRNVQTAIFDQRKGIYLNYEFFRLHDKTTITEVEYNLQPDVKEFVDKMLTDPEAFFTTSFEDAKLIEWLEYQQKASQFVDPHLYEVDSLHYYFYSIGPGALGVSTYAPLTENELAVFKRFRNVFELAYRRFIDIEKAMAQAREAQIEAALERVRAKVMAMNSSEDLNEASLVFGEQLRKLGIDWQFSYFWLIEEDKDENTFWITWPDNKTSTTTYSLAEADESFKECIIAWKEQVKIHSTHVPLQSVEAWLDTFERITNDAGGVAVEIMQPDNFKDGVYYYDAMIRFGSFGILMNRAVNDEEKNIQSRFATEFERAYTRFLDLQKAEAQAREAQIEAALERVRSRTMAMQRSEELTAVATVLFQQVKALGVPQWTCGFSIWEVGDKDFTWYPGDPDGVILPPAKVPLTEHPVFRQYDESKKRGDELFIYEKEGEVQADHYRYMYSLPGMHELLQNMLDAGHQFPTFQVDHLANFSHGNLIFITYKHFPEMHDVFKRFAKVFEQTYTRFLDLQKAEAQAREAQIELGLERVRARAMAMQKSDDLAGAVAIIFEELDKLNIGILRCGIGILNKENRSVNVWTTSKSDDNTRVQISGDESMDSHPLLQGAFNAWLKQEEYSYVLHGKDLIDYYKAQAAANFKLPDSQSLIKANENLYQYYFLATFQAGGLFAFRETAFPDEAKKVMKRFAGVFNLTYKRFLDLQKAEAQARESQIQLALERVRARTMAMQKSDELAETASLLFKQISQLGIETWTSGFNIWQENDTSFIGYNPSPEGGITSPYKIPSAEDSFFKKIYEAKKRGEDFLVFESADESLADTYRYMKTLPVVKDVLNGIEEAGFQLPTYQINHCAFFTQGFLLFITLEHYPVAHDIFKRFANVFEQTYTRFLDLQKAEAQAREAQIEAALERVRSRSMGMQKSDELRDVIQVIYEQLVQLNFEISNAGFLMDYRESDDGNIWMTDATTEFPVKQHIPYFDHPFNNDYLESKNKGQELFTKVYPFEEKNTWWEVVLKYLPGVSEETRKALLGLPALALSRVLLKNIGLYLFNYSGTPYSDSENATLLRFGKVFEQTYIRFNDLKNAEAQALEAIKRASVDRVRAEIASMRTINDLERITPLIWSELTTLGVPFIRCGVFIMDEEHQQVETHLSTPDGEAIATFNLPYNAPGEPAEILAHWHKKELYKQHWNEAQFVEFTQNLVQQGAVTSGEKYLTENRPTDLYLHFLPFLQGMLYAGNTSPLSDDALQLMQNLADAFSTAYARYEDFNKLETAKKEVDSALNKLQATQKQLIQSEKMASLGELTAGIAHEIQNPLNFVNNFSEVNKEMIDEATEEIDKGNIFEVKNILNNIKDNEEKINHHGKRADAIVKGMLQHSKQTKGVKEPTDINALCEEYLRLAYHGLRAKEKNFNADFKSAFDETIGKINIVPQDIGRVLLNLFNNAFYAANEKKKTADENYNPLVTVATKSPSPLEKGWVEVVVTDNGNGIPQNIIDKIFQPFFTTKPTGQGTGLGLSLSYDIIKTHGGQIKVETREGEGTEFIIRLPIV